VQKELLGILDDRSAPEVKRTPLGIEPPRGLEHETPLTELQRTVDHFMSLQRTDGYWWFTLEANETIGAEFLFLMHYLGEVDPDIERGIMNRILDVQRDDGTWSIYHDGPPDVSTTIECYFALKIAGLSKDDPRMQKARSYVLARGGIEKARVFTKIHLAMFGIVPWEACPTMPVEFILAPSWFPLTIYSFSSWARATIVPLLVFMTVRKTKKLPKSARIDELFSNPPSKRDYSFSTDKGLFSPENLFITFDKCLKLHERFASETLRNFAIEKCKTWIREHVNKAEDIYPALAYGALAFKALGYDNDAPEIRKPFTALKMFQQRYPTKDVPALPDEVRDNTYARPSELRALGVEPRVAREAAVGGSTRTAIHQQCCISPVWDTPWMVTSLLEAGVPANDPALLRAGRWLMRKQITECRGDWAVKNPKGKPGGWSFEFENDFYPDVDDTVQVLHALCRLAIPWREKGEAFETGLQWLLSMQNDDGGWGAFDRNQTQTIVNRIPFSDHGACLDSSSPDITARVLEFLASRQFSNDHPAVSRGLAYLWRTQEPEGPWEARWGVDYLYGTWCVLTALDALGLVANNTQASRAVTWLAQMQRKDGGYGESPDSYERGAYVPLPTSVPSQTAWALMGLIAGGLADSTVAARAAHYLLSNRNEQGAWDERHYTGTGFPRHFYIRYHGYRHFFPLLALARYLNVTEGK
jgi:squalene-hopene/tetraprenyl-beta-curcumene cyclase